jgi:hypothetical protein
MIHKSILDWFINQAGIFKIKVNLIYYKKNGKYYGEGTYMEDYWPLYLIWEKIEKMEKHPGLLGRWDGIISVDVPEHINSHPHLIMMKKGIKK